MKIAFLAAAFASAASAKELTTASYRTETKNKLVFIKFYAPWCGHCKALKPDWDKLIETFKGSEDKLIADVDCTTDEAKDLCAEWGVEGFPTLKWGNPYALQDYEGERDYDDLEEFVNENLKPMCGPQNLDLCDESAKKDISKYMEMKPEELKKLIDAKDSELKEINEHFDTEVDKISQEFEDAEKAKADKVKKIKDAGLSMMRAVIAAAESK